MNNVARQMTRSNSNILYFLRWFTYNILFPLLPMLFALFVTFLQSKTVSRADLFGGTELFFLSVTVLASTKSDLDRAKPLLKGFPIYYQIMVELILPLLVFAALVFAVIYIHENITDIGLSRDLISIAGIITSAFVTLFCVPLQILIADFEVYQQIKKN